MSSCDKKVLATDERNKLTIQCSVIAVLYIVLVLFPVVHNIHKYLIGQKRYVVLLTSLFYLFALFIAISGILNQITFAVLD